MVSTTAFPIGLSFSLLMSLDDNIHLTLLYLTDLHTLFLMSVKLLNSNLLIILQV